MDVAFTRAVRMGTDAVHAADPQALAALEGAQVPGWGGYDYTLLAPAVDVMEIYDYGEALDLAQAFNPALIPLRTSFAGGPRERHAVWRNLLHGGRGEVVWDEVDNVVTADGSAGPRGLELAELARAVGPVASALRAAAPDPDPVAVLYSPASFRVRWLLDRQAGDRDWAARDAEREYDDNAWRASRRVLVRRLAELGGAAAIRVRRHAAGGRIGGARDQGAVPAACHRAVGRGGCGHRVVQCGGRHGAGRHRAGAVRRARTPAGGAAVAWRPAPAGGAA